MDEEAPIQIESLEEKQESKIKTRFKRLGEGFRTRLLKFTIVSLIGLGVNLGALALTELIIGSITSVLDKEYIFWIFEFTPKGLIAIACGIAAATISNYLLNKFWTFGEAKTEKIATQFLKYAIVGASGAVIKYLLTTALTKQFHKIIPNIDNAIIAASSIAFVVTVFWNYTWNELWTFDVVKKVEEPIIVPPDKDYNKVTVITPTFNENENIGLLMETLTDMYDFINIIVADDGSTDGTREQVRAFHKMNPNVVLLDREAAEIHGLTISVKEAILMTTTPYYIVIDCDFQHPPEKVGEIAVRLDDGYHYVIGERDEIPDWPFTRRLISWGAKVIGKFSHFLHRSATCTDVMSGFYGADTAYSKKIINEHPKGFRPKGYKIMFELLKHSKKKETRIGRVGYVFNPRVRGESKISKKHIFEFLKSAFP